LQKIRDQPETGESHEAHSSGCLTIVPFDGLFTQWFKTVQLFKCVQKHKDFLVQDSPVVPTRREFAVLVRYMAFGQRCQESMGLLCASILSAAHQKSHGHFLDRHLLRQFEYVAGFLLLGTRRPHVRSATAVVRQNLEARRI
jgi:hypothetical protein